MVNKCAREGVLKVVGIVPLTHLRALCKRRCLLLSLICNVQKVQIKSTAKQPSGYTRYTVLILTWGRSDDLCDAINCSHWREIKILLGRFYWIVSLFCYLHPLPISLYSNLMTFGPSKSLMMLCSSLLLPQPPDNDVCSGFLIENLDSDRKIVQLVFSKDFLSG